jgi:predicted DNA-binding transcriptional regulator AlpA
MNTSKNVTGEVKGRVSVNPVKKPTYLTAKQVAERYSISIMTLWRWCHKGNQEFPCPVQFGRRNYWCLVDLQAWEARQSAQAWQSHHDLSKDILSTTRVKKNEHKLQVSLRTVNEGRSKMGGSLKNTASEAVRKRARDSLSSIADDISSTGRAA